MRDGLLGDKYGPFDQDQQDRERAKFDALKAAEKRRESQRSTGKRIQQNLEDELSEESDDFFESDD